MDTYDESIYGTRYGPAVQKASNVSDVSFCDVTDDRILDWLTDHVKEEHFANMKAWGAKLVRIPTGYWNWVDLGDGVTPNAPDDVAARYKNLQSVKPSQYRTFID